MSSKRIAAPGTSGEADSVCRKRTLMLDDSGNLPHVERKHLYTYKTLSLVKYWLRYDIPKVNNFFSVPACSLFFIFIPPK